jgi:hypothetical protein
MLFNNIFTIAIFSGIIIVSCRKSYTLSIGIFFYAYYAYAQTLTLIAFVLEYGIINTMVIAFCMLFILLITLFLLLELFLICLDVQNDTAYFKCSFISCLPILVLMLFVLLSQSVIFFVLRNYIIVLVY